MRPSSGKRMPRKPPLPRPEGRTPLLAGLLLTSLLGFIALSVSLSGFDVFLVFAFFGFGAAFPILIKAYGFAQVGEQHDVVLQPLVCATPTKLSPSFRQWL
jgi:hypothetical protein